MRRGEGKMTRYHEKDICDLALSISSSINAVNQVAAHIKINNDTYFNLYFSMLTILWPAEPSVIYRDLAFLYYKGHTWYCSSSLRFIKLQWEPRHTFIYFAQLENSSGICHEAQRQSPITKWKLNILFRAFSFLKRWLVGVAVLSAFFQKVFYSPVSLHSAKNIHSSLTSWI